MGAEKALKKLRNKLLVVNLISLTLVVTIAFSIIFINIYNRTQADIERAMLQIPRNVLENAILSGQTIEQSNLEDSNPNGGIIIRGEGRVPVDYSKSFVVNIATDGNISVFSLLELDNNTYLRAVETALTLGVPLGETDFAGRTWKYSVEQNTDFLNPYVYSMVFYDINDAKRSLSELAVSLFVIGIAAIAVIFMISMYMANRAIRPVEDSMARQRRFVADASHELKTPIAVIAANAEAASGIAGKADSISPWLNNITDEATRMNKLVESLLALAKAEEKNLDLAGFDLVEAVSEELNRIEVFMFEKEISFDFHVVSASEEKINIVSDKEKVQAIISVLLENAMKYTPVGGAVTVTIDKNGVFVTNTGTYIPDEQLVHLFDRFYRADPSRNSETGGHGIGLSLANEIAWTLGGKLTAESVLQLNDVAFNTFSLYLHR